MKKMRQAESAARFREQNRAGGLLLPNAWDAISAKIFESAGFTAIGTTSAGISFARGIADGERLARDEMMREIAAITNAVALPVTADVEAGYGFAPGDVAQTVHAVVQAGAVGINLEDSIPGSGKLFDHADQARRITAAREAATACGIDLFINARTDMFLAGLGESDEERGVETIERGLTYLESGADMVFVPGVVDTDIIERLAAAFEGQLNVMAMPGAPSAKELFAAGARRVSLGPFAMLGMLGRLREIANAVRTTGSFESITAGSMSFSDVQALVAKENNEAELVLEA